MSGEPVATRQPPPTTNRFALASLVCGLLGLVCILVPAALAVVFALVARRQMRERNEKGEGMAQAGLILGILHLSMLGLVVGWSLVRPLIGL